MVNASIPTASVVLEESNSVSICGMLDVVEATQRQVSIQIFTADNNASGMKLDHISHFCGPHSIIT